MNSSDVRSALVKAYTDLDLGLDTSYENKVFNPDSLPLWAKVSFLFNIPDVATLGEGGEDNLTGIMQIDLNKKLNTGESDLLAFVDTLRNNFTAGRRFSYNNQEVVIVNSGRTTSLISDNFFTIPFSVNWYSRLIRNIN